MTALRLSLTLVAMFVGSIGSLNRVAGTGAQQSRSGRRSG
jgi:hypothetical protein